MSGVHLAVVLMLSGRVSAGVSLMSGRVSAGVSLTRRVDARIYVLSPSSRLRGGGTSILETAASGFRTPVAWNVIEFTLPSLVWNFIFFCPALLI